MYIIIWAGGMAFNAKTIPNGESLGGSETAGYYMARELAKLGHDVTIFTNSQEPSKSEDGVTYEFIGEQNERTPLGDRYTFCAQVPHDVSIIQRVPQAYMLPVNSKLRILWMHDIALLRNAKAFSMSLPYLDYVFAVSEWHKKQIMGVYQLGERSVIATKNGVDPELFTPKDLGAREPRTLLYTARPERGLENLVAPGGIMERLPDCKLYVCGYDNTVPQMAQYYNFLWDRCRALPNVVNLGALGKKELAEMEAKVMLHVYPTTFEDTSCIALMESQHAGTPFISSQTAALPETGAGGGVKLLPLNTVDGKLLVNHQLFASTVKRILDNPKDWQAMHEKALAYKRPWSDVAEQWDSFFNNALREKCSDPLRMKKHYYMMSDIIAAEKQGFKYDNYDFYYKNEIKPRYDYYAEEREKMGIHPGPEDLSNFPRFKALCHKFNSVTQGKKDMKVMDCAMAYGPYLFNLRHKYGNLVKEWVGWDWTHQDVEIARNWKKLEKADNVTLLDATIDDLPEEYKGQFDVLIAGEILEHVVDFKEYVYKLKSFLKPDGHLLITVPYGPWEILDDSYTPEYWRLHLHHFERTDIIEVFGQQDDFSVLAVPSNQNYHCGWYIVTLKNCDKELGHIDYERKNVQQNPMETLSLCMIAKNEELEIGRCLAKLKGVVDEIIVGIDKTTTDKTREICERFGAKCIDIPSPLQIGFDEARNRTIAEATMDWILWVDADEIVENAGLLQIMLRHSPIDGYAIQQHHLGVNPPGVQKTDYPCRLFRNRIGARFFGIVHEHPELSLNAGMGTVIIASEVAIAHYGYSTEAIRRERFKRNFPLMQKDREKYPERRLGKMLWIRDLAHIVRYERERNNGALTETAVQSAHEAMRMWRELLTDKGIPARMVMESLQYYSECTSAIGEGIQYAVSMSATLPGADLRLPEHVPAGFFLNESDLRLYTNFLLNEELQNVTRKYI